MRTTPLLAAAAALLASAMASSQQQRWASEPDHTDVQSRSAPESLNSLNVVGAREAVAASVGIQARCSCHNHTETENNGGSGYSLDNSSHDVGKEGGDNDGPSSISQASSEASVPPGSSPSATFSASDTSSNSSRPGTGLASSSSVSPSAASGKTSSTLKATQSSSGTSSSSSSPVSGPAPRTTDSSAASPSSSPSAASSSSSSGGASSKSGSSAPASTPSSGSSAPASTPSSGSSSGKSSESNSSSPYTLAENFFDGDGFFSHFNFSTDPDPTQGTVEFISESEAQASGIINSTGSSAWMGADSTTVLTGNQGRKAVRVSSKSTYTHMLVVMKADRLPISCGSWPAFWTVGPQWPGNGEIDIIEGVHLRGPNQMTLHSGPGCSASGQSKGLLPPVLESCEGGLGCGFTQTSNDSWRNANQAGGGIWAMEWTSDHVAMWWWSNSGSDDSLPADLLSETPTPAGWGTPQMYVPSGSNCDLDKNFVQHRIVFDWTFCGSWAGTDATWGASGCASSQYPTCQSFVQNNPGAYKDLGFDVRYLKVFSLRGDNAGS